MINQERLEISNKIIALLMPKTRLFVRNHRIWVEWVIMRSLTTKQWQTSRGSFYPTWSNKFPTGGTYTVAIAQLINWIRDRPCYPIQTWEYWFGNNVGMDGREEILPLLQSSDYPKEMKCYFCGRTDVRFDWYSFGKRSGIGCWVRCEILKDLMDKLS